MRRTSVPCRERPKSATESDNALPQAGSSVRVLGRKPLRKSRTCRRAGRRALAGPGRTLRGQEPGGAAALVPENDEMVLVNNAFSVAKTDLYRSNVGRGRFRRRQRRDGPAEFCQNMTNVQTSFLNALLRSCWRRAHRRCPPSATTSSRSWLTGLSMSFANLSCQDYGLTNPVTVTDGRQRRSDGRDPSTPRGERPETGGGPVPGQRRGRSHHRRTPPAPEPWSLALWAAP